MESIINTLNQMFILLFKCWCCKYTRSEKFYYRDKTNRFYDICKYCYDKIKHKYCMRCCEVLYKFEFDHKDDLDCVNCYNIMNENDETRCDDCHYIKGKVNFQKLPNNKISNFCNECLNKRCEKWCLSCNKLTDEDEYFDEFHECVKCYEKYKNQLDHTHPEIAKQFHPTMNGNKKPRDFTYGSNKEIWWICDKNPCGNGCLHIWKVKICDRTSRKGSGCPYAGCCIFPKKTLLSLFISIFTSRNCNSMAKGR